jgi:hypothetical protein
MAAASAVNNIIEPTVEEGRESELTVAAGLYPYILDW